MRLQTVLCWQLYLWPDISNIIFKLKLHIVSGSAPSPPEEKSWEHAYIDSTAEVEYQ